MGNCVKESDPGRAVVSIGGIATVVVTVVIGLREGVRRCRTRLSVRGSHD